MKYLKSKNARRRGIAMEMAITVLLVLAAMSTITVVTTMIHVNKYDSIHDNFEQQLIKYDLETIGGYYFKNIDSFNGKQSASNKTALEEEAKLYLIEKYEEVGVGDKLIEADFIGDTGLKCTLTYKDDSEVLATLEIEITVDGSTYTITKWEYK